MEFHLVVKPLTSHVCDALAVGLHEPASKLDGPVAALDRALDRGLQQVLSEEGFNGRLGRTVVVHTHGRVAPRRVIVVGLGPERARSAETVRTAAAAATRRAVEMRLRHLAFAPIPEREARLRLLTQARVEGVVLGAYRFERYRSEPVQALGRVDLLLADRTQQKAAERGLAEGRLFADATVLARDLTNEPANVLTPTRLAERAAEVGKEAGLRVTALGPGGLSRLGMNALLAVARGSAEEPRLIVMDYTPASPRRTVAIVGKGLTFDSGGLDLKRSEEMATMKEDMAGAAAVLGVMSAVAKTVKTVRVLGIAAAAENMPGPAAMKPGDIVKAMNGKTIEITNTDAEGRLVLADALAYAAGQRVNEIIDIATLTGGARIALGPHAAAILGTDPRLVEALRQAGEEAGERLWPLPLYEEFSEAMKSKVADLRNSASRWGSPEKGAAFLKEFTGGKPWAHLDIAPVAFVDLEEGAGAYRPQGSATGFGVRTLLTYLRRLDRPG
jgi:leucyl aminopeptidase